MLMQNENQVMEEMLSQHTSANIELQWIAEHVTRTFPVSADGLHKRIHNGQKTMEL